MDVGGGEEPQGKGEVRRLGAAAQCSSKHGEQRWKKQVHSLGHHLPTM